jgi:hypothetical protein
VASPFETYIRLRVDQMAGPEAVKAFHVKTAKAALSEFMARQSVRPMVDIEVDTRPARSETEVKPFGLIVYRFGRMREVVSFALRELERLSPVRSGAYRKAWRIVSLAVASRVGRPGTMANGNIGLDQLDGATTVTIVNPLPYARKVHTGAKGFEVPAGILEKVRQLILKRYRRIVYVGIQFISLSPGYRLKKPPRSGQPLTYPALVIEAL